MVYIKSVLIGVLTGGTAMVTSTILWMFIAAYQIRGQFPHGEIAFDLRSALARPSLLWLATVAGFCARVLLAIPPWFSLGCADYRYAGIQLLRVR